jgi:hypothetical protein
MLQRLICFLLGHKRTNTSTIEGPTGEKIIIKPYQFCWRCGKYLGEWWKGGEK